MNEEELRVVVALPGEIDEIAEKQGLSRDYVKKILEGLFVKGVVIPRDFWKRDHYRFVRDIVQLHDATLASRRMRDPVYAGLWKEFGEKEAYAAIGMLNSMMGVKVWRVVPAYEAIRDLPGVLPHENMLEMIKTQDRIAVVPCSCRNVTHLVGIGCRFTKEHPEKEETWHCIQVGRGAEYVIARGSGRELTKEEAIELIHRIEEDGLVHTWPNTAKIVDRRVTVNCNCCRDCCEFFLSARFANIPMSSILEKSRYVAYVDRDLCIACGTCVARCHFNAITIDEVAKVNEEECFGCGVCVLGCKQGAIKLKVIRPPEHIPP